MTRVRANVTLLAVVAFVVVVAGPALGAPITGPCPNGGPIGPCPGWVDLNADGQYETGEPLIWVRCAAAAGVPTTLTIDNPWSTNCGDSTGNQILLSGSGACYDNGIRMKPGGSSEMQQIVVTSFNGSNQPEGFRFFENSFPKGDGSLTGTGGGASGVQLTGGLTMLVGPFQGTDPYGGSGFHYVSIPWALAQALGMNGPCKLGAVDPQVFLPVVDIGGGQYQIQFDLCSSDTKFCSSPPLSLVAWRGVGTNIPTTTELGTIVLVLCLATVGWWFVRRQQVLA